MLLTDLLLEQGVELVIIKELLGHANTGVTATVYAHVRLRLQREAMQSSATPSTAPDTRTATAVRHDITVDTGHPMAPLLRSSEPTEPHRKVRLTHQGVQS